MRVLVFGDSITQGYWDTEGGWVNRLRKHYDEMRVEDLQTRDDPEIFNLGVSADTSDSLLQRIEPETVARKGTSDVLPAVIVQIGVNDSSSHGDNIWVPIVNYSDNLHDIIAKLKTKSSKIIFIGMSSVDDTKTNPVSWGNYFYKNEAIKIYEDSMAEVAKQNDIPFIPIFDKFKTAFDAGNNFLPDGLHPNNAGHQLITDIVLPELDKFFAG